jgi:hypothetical protein
MPATDDYVELTFPPSGPCRRAASVTPSDSSDLSNVSRYLYVGGTGDITATSQGGDSIVFKAVPVGTVLPVALSRIKATGTTATNLVVIW